MSGHSKWSTIKHKKGAADAKRGRMFTRIVKEITIAVKEGGPEADSNPRLRTAIQNAKGVNMPKDNIERAINKASDDGSNLEEVTFEGYGVSGIAIFVECLSDNNNRTVSSVRATFNKYGGNLGTNGSLSFIFETKGVFTFKKGDLDIEEIELEVIDAGAEDIELDDPVSLILDRTKLKDSLADQGISIEGLTSANTLRDVLKNTVSQLLKRQNPNASTKTHYDN